MMRYGLGVALVCSLAGLVTGCGGSDLKTFPVAKVTGRVLCESEPVPNAQVFFYPLQEGKSANIGKGGHAYTNDKGEFTLSTYGKNDGAVIGTHQVRVRGEDGFLCPCDTSGKIAAMEAVVESGKKNEFEIVLKPDTRPTSKKKRDEDDE